MQNAAIQTTWPAAIAEQLEAAYAQGRARGEVEGEAKGWAACASRYGLPLTVIGRHRERRHLAVVPDAAALRRTAGAA